MSSSILLAYFFPRKVCKKHTNKKHAKKTREKKAKGMRRHFTMKNEGWGIKEDQIPSSSHLLHQTMGSQLHMQCAVQQIAFLMKRSSFCMNDARVCAWQNDFFCPQPAQIDFEVFARKPAARMEKTMRTITVSTDILRNFISRARIQKANLSQR